jgi:GT2 family glycosyltransferase
MSVPPPAVVIVTHVGGPRLEACVRSLHGQGAAELRVVVSRHDPLPVPPGAIGQQLRANPGFAGAANAGLRAVSPALPVVLLNDDTVAAPGFLAALRAAAAGGGPGIYQPVIELDGAGGALDNAGHGLLPDGANLARGRGGRAVPPGAEAGAFSGAAVWLCPEVRSAVGLFDESFEAYGEDVDLSLRAVRQGYRVRVVPEARIRHALGASYGRASPRKVFLVERNRVRAAVRSLPWAAVATMPLSTPARYGLLLAAAAGGRGLGAGVGPAGAAAAVAGALASLRHLPADLRARRAAAPAWRVDDRGMWGHLWAHRPRRADLLATLGPA